LAFLQLCSYRCCSTAPLSRTTAAFQRSL